MEAAETREIRLGELAGYIDALSIGLEMRFLGQGLLVRPLEEPISNGNGHEASLEESGLCGLEAELEAAKAALEESQRQKEALGQLLESEKRRQALEGLASAQLANEREQALFWQGRALQLATEFRLCWSWLHSGQRERIRQALQSDEQRTRRASLIHAGVKNIPALPLPLALQTQDQNLSA